MSGVPGVAPGHVLAGGHEVDGDVQDGHRLVAADITRVGPQEPLLICGWRRSIWDGWRAPTTLGLKELDEFLLARAMEPDSPTLPFRPAICILV